jgi:hypothetical protein
VSNKKVTAFEKEENKGEPYKKIYWGKEMNSRARRNSKRPFFCTLGAKTILAIISLKYVT